ncbi:MAG TPA: DUF4159 domain-containing protein [Vicinamibacterales bacterium]|nr:DUF4159 domain-containing protein [Vicinamibacterales bacterium]
MRKRTLATVALIVLVTVAAAAQRGGRRGGFAQRAFTTASLTDFDGTFQFCRVAFRGSANGDGGNWSVDFPRADQNLSIRLAELTKTPVGMDVNDVPKHLLISLQDPEVLSHCAFIMMTEVGSLYLDDQEAANLRDYLLKGGFLWADDFWGSRAWDMFESQIHRVLPSGSYPIVDLPIEHPIFHSQMVVTRVPQIPSINFWGGPGGPTSERGSDSAVPHARAILDAHQRVMVFITHNTDVGDSFEREGDSRAYFVEFSVPGYALGVNVLLYALTH